MWTNLVLGEGRMEAISAVPERQAGIVGSTASSSNNSTWKGLSPLPQYSRQKSAIWPISGTGIHHVILTIQMSVSGI